MRTIGVIQNGRYVVTETAEEAARGEARLQEVIESHCFPSTHTEQNFQRLRGKKLREQFCGNEKLLKAVVRSAKAHGYTPGENDIYEPQLAAFDGDPAAFVTGRADVKRVAEARDITVKGMVENRRVKDPEPRKKVKLAKSLVDAGVRELVRREPGLASKPVGELRERVVDERACKVCELDP